MGGGLMQIIQCEIATVDFIKHIKNVQTIEHVSDNNIHQLKNEIDITYKFYPSESFKKITDLLYAIIDVKYNNLTDCILNQQLKKELNDLLEFCRIHCIKISY